MTASTASRSPLGLGRTVDYHGSRRDLHGRYMITYRRPQSPNDPRPSADGHIYMLCPNRGECAPWLLPFEVSWEPCDDDSIHLRKAVRDSLTLVDQPVVGLRPEYNTI